MLSGICVCVGPVFVSGHPVGIIDRHFGECVEGNYVSVRHLWLWHEAVVGGFVCGVRVCVLELEVCVGALGV